MYWRKIILIAFTNLLFANNLDDLRLDAMLNEMKNATKSHNAYLRLYEQTKLKSYLEDAIKQGYLANINMDKEVSILQEIDKNNDLIKKINIVKLIEQKDFKNAKKTYYNYIKKHEDYALANAMSKELLHQGFNNDALKIAKDYYYKYENPYSLFLYLEMLMANNDYKKIIKLTDDINKNAEENNKIDESLAPYLKLRLEALKALDLWEQTIRLDPKGYLEHLMGLMDKKDYKTILKHTKNIAINSDYAIFLFYRFGALYELCDKSNADEFYQIGMALYNFTGKSELLASLAKKLLDLNQKTKLENIAKLDEELAFKIYFNLKNYKKLSELSMQKALKTNNNSYLIEAYIYEMLDNPKRFDYFKLDELVAKGGFSASMLNIYAYTIIDEKIDIKKGIELVKKALEIEPNNEYYLDTLAWGYYLINDCKNAQETMQKVLQNEDILKEDEVKFHNQRINKCKN